MGVVLGAVAVLAGVLGAGLHAANAAEGRTAEPSFWLMGLAAAVGYGTVSLLLHRTEASVTRRVLGGIGVVQGLSLLCSEWALLDPHVPLRDWSLWLGTWLWAPGYAAIAVLLPLLLPDGHVPGPRWRPALWLVGSAVLLTAASWALTPYDEQDFPEALVGATNPVGVDGLASSPVWDLGGALALVALGVAFASLLVRWRRSVDVERQQIKWVALGYVATIVCFVGARLLPIGPAEVVAALAMVPLPLAIGVAVLRHGLWGVDVVISRTLVYGLLSAVVLGAYAGTVWLFTDLLGARTGAPVLAATLVALLALPARSWLQRHVNRWVHGDVEEPYAVLARLGDRLASAAAPEELAEQVLPSVVEQVARSLRARQVTLVLRDGSRTSYGESGVGDPLTVPLVYAGERLGDLTVHRPAGFDEGAVDALDRLAAQAAVAGHTVLLAREMQRAREAVVLAREEERRRLRRDLHDGVGPVLAALALHAETARDLAEDDPAAATRLLDVLVPRLNAAVADVRAMVHELRPPMLDELGLGSALHALADRLSTATTRVVVDAGPLPELPAAVEVAAYHIAVEAVGNAVRHAGAGTVRVSMRCTPEELTVTVGDDGAGIPDVPRPGLGTMTMRERAAELGGRLDVRSGRAGTVVEATLPLVVETATSGLVGAR